MATEKEQIEKMIAQMLSGVAFTYMGLSMTYFQEPGSRIVDREMQKLRKKGLVGFSRKHRPPIWRATAAGQVRLAEMIYIAEIERKDPHSTE